MLILSLNMQFVQGNFYHIYNRGNNQQTIFFSRENYLFFLDKVYRYLKPTTDIVAWTLMPNHFHFLIHANEQTVASVKTQPIIINTTTEAIRLLLSSYTKALQVQRGFTGNLFQQKTKSKCVFDTEKNYVSTAFHYIHQNALNAGLCISPEEWEFSSLQDYSGIRNGNLCNYQIAQEYLNINAAILLEKTNQPLEDAEISNLY